MADTIKVEGISQAVKKLDKLGGKQLVRKPMHAGVLYLQRRIAKYPAKPPWSRYRRTGLLGRQWTTAVKDAHGAVFGEVGNTTPYGPDVQGEKQRPIFKKIGWKTIVQVAKAEEKAVLGIFEAAVKENT